MIDAKRYKGRPELSVEGGMFRPRQTGCEGRGAGCCSGTREGNWSNGALRFHP